MKKSVIHVIVAGILLLTLLSCRNDPFKSLDKYYFPVHQLEEPMVYEYRSVTDSLALPEFWIYKMAREGKKTMLLATYVTPEGDTLQQNQEEIVSTGALLRSLEIIDRDTLGQAVLIPVKILGNNAFPFEASDSFDIFFYKIQWQQPDDQLEVFLTRNRRPLLIEKCEYQDWSTNCLKVELKELLETNQEGFTQSQWTGYELYAKGVGLVYYKKQINENFQLEYALKDRYSLNEFREKYQAE